MTGPPAIDDWDVSEIKSVLLKCRRIVDVNDTVRHYAKKVLAMENSPDPDARTMAIQIKNLAKYQRLAISEGWV